MTKLIVTLKCRNQNDIFVKKIKNKYLLKKKKTSLFIRLQIEVVISTMKRKNHVHDHIVLDILARLPVKSIIKFRCVCKAWYSSITEPYFIFTHLINNNKKDKDKDYLGTRVFQSKKHETRVR